MNQLNTLTAQQIVTVIDLICTLSGMGRETCLQEISDIVISTSKLKERKDFPDMFLKDLSNHIQSCEPPTKHAILGYISGVAGKTEDKLHTSMQEWIEPRDVISKSFSEKCTGKNGHYLIFRSPAPGKCELAEMTIRFDAKQHLMPVFETTFHKNGLPHNTIKGTIFEVGNHAYAIGKSVGNKAIRFSKLRPYTQPSGQTDLYGVRVSQSIEVNRPNAHFIYCYQLRKPRKPEVVSKLLSQTDFKDGFLQTEVTELAHIQELLESTALQENGIVAKQFGEG